MNKYMMNIMIMMNLIFINTKNPLLMGLILIMQTMLLSIMTGMMNLTFWMSMIIFLVFIGGMLILFIYVISLLNSMMIINYKNMLYIMLLSLSFMIINKNFNYNNNLEMMNFTKIMHLNNENSINLIKMYNMPNMIMMSLLITYLFILMIFSNKVTNYYLGPMYKF